MSQSGRRNVGRPDAMVEYTFYYFIYCGGSGGGDCLPTLGVPGVSLPFAMPKTIVRHNRIVFENREFFGVRIYTDGGPAAFCDHSVGTEVPFYMYLSENYTEDGDTIMAKGVQLSGALPYEIEFLADKIPQPNKPGYTGTIYMHLWWGNSGYISSTGWLPNKNSLKITKHDYDIVQ